MRGKFVALALLAFLATQSLAGLEWLVGARGGAAANYLGGTYWDSVEASLFDLGAGAVTRQAFFSYCAGASLRMKLPKVLSFQADLGFGPGGGGMLASDGADILKGIWGNQLDLSILVLVSLRLGRIYLNLLAGPGLQFCLGSPLLVTNDGYMRSEADLAAAGSLWPAMILVGGAGVWIPLGPGFLLFDARLNAGLTSVLPSLLPDDPTLRFSAVRVSSGYELPLRSKKRVEK